MVEGKGCYGGETKNGATATYPKMMPRQHIGSGSSRRYRCKRRRANERNMQDGGVITDSGFPWVGGMAKEGHRKDDSVTVQTYGTSHTTKHSFKGVVSAVIPLKRAFSEWFESSREVVVHVATVVVHIVVEVVVPVPWMFGVHGVFEGRR